MSDEPLGHDRTMRDGRDDGRVHGDANPSESRGDRPGAAATGRLETDDLGTDDLGTGGPGADDLGTEDLGIGGPTYGSTAVVLMSVGLGAVLAVQVGPAVSAVVAIGAAITYAASLWLVDRDRWQLPADILAGLLTLVVGAGLTVAIGYTTLELVSSLFPATAVSQIRPRGLRVTSVTLVATGATLAIIGGTTAVGSVLRTETARAHADLAVKTFVVPLSAGALSLVSTVFTRGEQTPLAAVLDPLVALRGALLHPAPGRAHLLTFSLFIGATAVAVYYALDALPVTELSTGPRRERATAIVETARTWTRRVVLAAAASLVPFALIEFAFPPSFLASVLPDPLYTLLAVTTGADVLRLTALVFLVASLGLLGVVRVLRRSVQSGPRDLAVELTPFVGGGAIVALVLLTHGQVLDPALSFVADRLPGAFETMFEQQSALIVDIYGTSAVTMIIAAALVGVTTVLSLSLALGTTMGSLPDRVIAPGLASTGLFLAAAIGAGAGIGAPLALTGIVASLVVWDAGEYGVGIGREVGRGAHTRSPELVHIGATLVVGVFAALAARSLLDFTTGATIQSVPTLSFAFAVVLVGLVLLVTALR